MADDKWTWDSGDIEWDKSPPKKGAPKLKPLLDAEGLKIATENLKRIRAGKPLLNGQSPTAKQED